MAEVLSAILLLAGSLVILIGSVGLLRFPNFFSRLHSAGVIDTLGAWLIVLALLLLVDDLVVGFKVVLIAALLFLLSPVSSNALAKAGAAFGLRADDGIDSGDQGPEIDDD